MNVNNQFKGFYFKLVDCVQRHAPYKKFAPKDVIFNQKP